MSDKKTPSPVDPIRVLRGILKGKPSLTKDLLKERKEEVKREEKILGSKE
jgi:hypothetical protein